MLKKQKRILSLMLCVAMLLSVLPRFAVPVAAEAVTSSDYEGTCGENVSWYLTSGGGLQIYGSGDMEDYSEEDPAPWYSLRQEIYWIYIGSEITGIGDYAFWDCDGLYDVSIPDTVTSVGSHAFADCDRVTGISVSKSVTSVGSYAFADCDSLRFIVFNGAAPTFGENCFDQLAVAVGHSCVDPTWTEAVRQSYGGIVTWPGHLFYAGSDVLPASCYQEEILNGSCSICSASLYVRIDGTALDHDFSTGYTCRICGDLPTLEEGKCGNFANWRLDVQGNLYITGSGAVEDYTAEEPAPWYPLRQQIQTVYIHDRITRIGDYAFRDCDGVTVFAIPVTVSEVGRYAFAACDRLQQIAFYGPAPTFEENCFDQLYTLVTHSCQNETWTEAVEQSYGGNVTWVGHWLSGTDTQAPTCTQDETLRGYCAQCGETVTVAIAGTALGHEFSWDGQCYRCYEWETIDSGLCGDQLYWSVDRGGKLVITGSGDMWNFGSAELVPWSDYRYSITDVRLEDGITSIGNYGFYGLGPYWIDLPQSVTAIGDYAFSNCLRLREVYIPDGVSVIGDYAFSGCWELLGVNIPEGVSVIGDHTFYECTYLRDITLPASVQSIGDYAFSGCTSLYLITIPDGVRSIGDYAFSECTYLREITIPESVTYIGQEAFVRTCIDTLFVPGDEVTIADRAFRDCGSLSDVTICGDVSAIGEEAFYNCYSLLSVSVTGDVASIGDSAFVNCGFLHDVTVLGGVTEIGNDAFARCRSLTNVTISEGVKHIGRSAFTETALTDISFIKNVVTIGDGAFEYTNITSLPLPDTVTYLGDFAFRQCDFLTEVTIPASVTYIGSHALEHCDRLTKVIFLGSAPEMGSYCLGDRRITAYHSCTDSTWTSGVKYNCGFEVVWKDHLFGNYVPHQDATCTQDAMTVAYCPECGAEDVVSLPDTATGHSYALGVCTSCGEADPDAIKPVVIPTLTLKAPTLEFKDMITVNAMFTAENTDDVVEMGMITYGEEVDVVDINTAEHVIPGTTYDVNTGRYIASSQGIHAKYISQMVYLACYAKLTDGSYVYTKLASYSPINYATNQLENSSNVKVKQLVVSMLNYGAAAQAYFGYNADNPADSGMTADQMALVQSYTEDMVSSVPAVAIEKQGSFVNNQGFASRKPAVSFEGAFSINYLFTPKYVPVDGLTLYYWNEADFEEAEVLTVENATGTIAMTGEGTGEYRGDIEGIAAKDISQAVYVAVVYSDGTNTWTSGVLGYSIGAYCKSQATKGGAIADLAKATAVYGYQAKQYFG